MSLRRIALYVTRSPALGGLDCSLGLRSKLGIPSAANDQSGRLPSADRTIHPPYAGSPCLSMRLATRKRDAQHPPATIEWTYRQCGGSGTGDAVEGTRWELFSAGSGKRCQWSA